jgi:hypothetical protein
MATSKNEARHPQQEKTRRLRELPVAAEPGFAVRSRAQLARRLDRTKICDGLLAARGVSGHDLKPYSHVPCGTAPILRRAGPSQAILPAIIPAPACL